MHFDADVVEEHAVLRCRVHSDITRLEKETMLTVEGEETVSSALNSFVCSI